MNGINHSWNQSKSKMERAYKKHRASNQQSFHTRRNFNMQKEHEVVTTKLHILYKKSHLTIDYYCLYWYCIKHRSVSPCLLKNIIMNNHSLIIMSLSLMFTALTRLILGHVSPIRTSMCHQSS